MYVRVRTAEQRRERNSLLQIVVASKLLNIERRTYLTPRKALQLNSSIAIAIWHETKVLHSDTEWLWLLL